MKTTLSFALTLMLNSAFAVLPDALHCTSEAVYEDAKDFTVSGLNTDGPEISIMDAQFEDQSAENDTFAIRFSNECDNMYGLEFSSSDLSALVQGRVASIKGKMDYAQAGYEDPTDGDDEISEVVELTCVAKKN